jgi:hypothetical protein
MNTDTAGSNLDLSFKYIYCWRADKLSRKECPRFIMDSGGIEKTEHMSFRIPRDTRDRLREKSVAVLLAP